MKSHASCKVFFYESSLWPMNVQRYSLLRPSLTILSRHGCLIYHFCLGVNKLQDKCVLFSPLHPLCLEICLRLCHLRETNILSPSFLHQNEMPMVGHVWSFGGVFCHFVSLVEWVTLPKSAVDEIWGGCGWIHSTWVCGMRFIRLGSLVPKAGICAGP